MAKLLNESDPFIRECLTLGEANETDLTKYRFSERMSAERRSFVFVKRGGK